MPPYPNASPRRRVTAFVLKLLAGLLVAAPTAKSAADESLLTEIRAVDADRISALVAGDLPKLRSVFDPACVYTHASGREQTGRDYLAALERGEVRYEAMAWDFPPAIRLLDERVAIVSGRIVLQARGHEGPARERVLAATALYHRVEAGWRLVAYQSTPATAAPSHTVLSQTAVIPDVCAWPKLILLPDGTLIAALYNQPSHGQLPGDTACWASTDGGKTWTQRGQATQHEGLSGRFNHALGLASNGDLLVAASGWTYASPTGGKSDRPLPTIVTRSTDQGRTWHPIGNFPAAPEFGKELIPFGTIERGPDHRLRIATYSFGRGLPGPRKDQGYVVGSGDDGVTWFIDSTIDAHEVNETDLFYAGDGRWLAAARNLGDPETAGPHAIDLYVSDDNARTWQRHEQLTLADQHPGDLLQLADGRILLTYGDRRGPDFGLNAKVSADRGQSWSPAFRIARGFSSRDSGYPSSVQLADGTVVTAYYARGATDHDGYHMGVVRWRLD